MSKQTATADLHALESQQERAKVEMVFRVARKREIPIAIDICDLDAEGQPILGEDGEPVVRTARYVLRSGRPDALVTALEEFEQEADESETASVNALLRQAYHAGLNSRPADDATLPWRQEFKGVEDFRRRVLDWETLELIVGAFVDLTTPRLGAGEGGYTEDRFRRTDAGVWVPAGG